MSSVNAAADRRVLELLHEARSQLESERARRTEPLAIVGIGCRFPGGVDRPAAFWDLLRNGVDATKEMPDSRWNATAFFDPDPGTPGKYYVTRGGFLDQVDGFEPEFFGISPREAISMDPQQRLLLEVVWEALEDSGIPPESLRGSQTGVWIGLCVDDYARRSITSGDPTSIDPYSALGNMRSIAAGRIAYFLDLRGPSVQVDTSCSSSLVALHLACQSLRAGETNLAMVGGVNLMLAPEPTIALCKLRALASDGRCKTFDAAADGYARGEGCGVIVLKRLSDAIESGDRVHAVIRGSAVNHDGRSNGLTAPNGLAQEAVIRSALENAALAASEVDYVEAHGTGTLLGDPIEVLALNRVYGEARSRSGPLFLGSVKTNFGHLEGAAGIAAVIKTALCLANSEIAPHLNLRRPNPKIAWDTLPIRIPTELTSWPDKQGPRVAGVSSFGISGTNAHVLMQAPPPAGPQSREQEARAQLVLLSAKTPAALAASAARLREYLSTHPGPGLDAVAYELLARRPLLDQRLAIVASDRVELAAALQLPPETAPAAPSEPVPRKIAFVFPGQGSQWLGMGRQLLTEEPAFRSALGESDRAIQAETGWSALAELSAGPETSRLDRIDIVQPVLFAIQVALAELWRSWGVEADVVVGHSMGEIAAACVAGALSVRDAARIVCRRSKLLTELRGEGAMALVELSMSEALEAIAGQEDRLAVGVSNSRRSTVLSGDPAALDRVMARLQAKGVFCRHVKVDVASHSPQVDPLLSQLVSELAELRPTRGRVPILSTVTLAQLAGDELTASYWASNLRQPVRFAESIERLLADGVGMFVEISPHPLLVTAIDQIRRDVGARGVAVGSLRREQPERPSLLNSLGTLIVAGHSPAVDRLFSTAHARVDLPTYAWQRTSYWLDRRAPKATGAWTSHPMLGAHIPSAGLEAVYEAEWSTNSLPWLADHRVGGKVVVPGAALLELVRAASAQHTPGVGITVSEVTLRAPIVMPEQGGLRVQVVLTDSATRAMLFSQPSGAEPGAEWILHATAELTMASGANAPRDVSALRQECDEPLSSQEIYRSFASVGIELGPTFRGIRALWRGREQALAEIQLDPTANSAGYGIHPTLLDAALQLMICLVGEARDSALLPFEFRGFTLYDGAPARAIVHASLIGKPSSDEVSGAITILDEAGACIGRVDELRLRRADAFKVAAAAVDHDSEAFYRLDWRPVQAKAQNEAGDWLLIPVGSPKRARELRDGLRAAGSQCELLSSPDDLERQDIAGRSICICAGSERGGAEAIDIAAHTLRALQLIVQSRGVGRVCLMTTGAAAVKAGDEPAPAGAALWGLGRTLMQEHPELSCVLVDVGANDDCAKVLACEGSAADDETEVAWRGGERYVARLVRATAAGGTPAERKLEPQSTTLITGGLGALGLETARVLAERGIRHLVLVGRNLARSPEVERAISEIEALGARVTAMAADVTRRDELARVISSLPRELPLRGVVHAAGILDDGLLTDQTTERFGRVMSAKVLGASHLNELTAGLDLDLFVLFSSLAGSFGSAGQAGYAAANCFLDALAARRQALGLVGQSLAWGPWAERGLAASHERDVQTRLGRQGIRSIEPARGRELLAGALSRSDAQLIVAPLDLRLAARALGSSPPPLWRALLRAPAASSTPKEDLRPELARLSPAKKSERLLQVVRGDVARILSLGSPSAVPLDKPLRDLGFDSLMALELRNALSRRTGVSLSGAFAEQPTVEAIAHFIASRIEVAPSELGRQRPLSNLQTTMPAAPSRDFRNEDGKLPKTQVAICEAVQQLEAPEARLFCFHDAGGTPALFGTFAELSASEIEVHTIALSREVKPTAESAEQYLDEAARYVRALSDRPCILLGHSLGVLFARRVAHELTARHSVDLALFIASAPPPPASGVGWTNEDAVQLFARIFGDKGASMDKLRARFLIDCAMCSLLATAHSPLASPIAAYVGRDDPFVSEAALRQWRECTTRDFSITVVPGGHFYIYESESQQVLLGELPRQISAELASIDGPKPPQPARSRRCSTTQLW